MPALQVGQELRKLYNGTEYVVTVTGVNDNGSVTGVRMNGVAYTSLTAVVKAIRGTDYAISGWSFFGLVNPVQRQRGGRGAATPTTTCKGKCTHIGCYEPADCKHGFCQAHCTHEHRLGAYSSRKYPRCSALHIGVEIEVTYADQLSYRRGLPLEGHADGSLGSYGAEYKLLGKTGDIVDKAQALVEELWKRGARVNRKCGLHVHIDARQLSETRKNQLKAWAEHTQEVWFKLMPQSRRSSDYVQRIGDSYDNHRTWFNYTPYNTAEVRLHGGTLNPYKIAGWLTALIHLQAKANDATYTFPATGNATADFWTVFADCPAVGREYLETRNNNGGVVTDRAYRHIEE